MRREVAKAIAFKPSLEMFIRLVVQKILTEKTAKEEIEKDLKQIETLFMLEGVTVKRDEINAILEEWATAEIKRRLK